MNTSKYILLSTLLLLPMFISAQQNSRRYFVLSNGDTTLVVNQVSGGLNDKDSQFLKRRSGAIDSAFLNLTSKYKTLEEAALDVTRIRNKVLMEESYNQQDRNDALSFRLTKGSRNMRKENTVNDMVDSILRINSKSRADLEYLSALFGDKPTYYINGTVAQEEEVNVLQASDILKRTFRVTDTASGNPNGEIWFEVTDKALYRIAAFQNANAGQTGIVMPHNITPTPIPSQSVPVSSSYAPSQSSSKQQHEQKAPKQKEERIKTPKQKKQKDEVELKEVEIKVNDNGKIRTVKGFRPEK